MLGDFPLSITFDGERVQLIARDVPVAVFFYGFPDIPLDADRPGPRDLQALDRQLEAWMTGLLTRVIVQPRLSLELIHRLGEAALEARVGYLHAVGWWTDEILAGFEAGQGMGRAVGRYRQGFGAVGAELLADVVAEPATYEATLWPFIKWPAPAVVAAVRAVMVAGHASAAAIWKGPISEFIFNRRMLMTEEAWPPAPGMADGQ